MKILKLGGVVIHMKNEHLLKFNYGDMNSINTMISMGALEPFNSDVIDFLDSVSKMLLKSPHNRLYQDIITFAFWIRRASILKMKQKYSFNNRLGRGISFHIAPSNVPINFAYSLVSSLLAGNSNIVRLSSKNFDQTKIISDALSSLKKNAISQRIVLLQYEHNKEITDYFSSICDSRIVWGGDQTINKVRESRIKPRGFDIAFADRYSIAIINSNSIMQDSNLEPLIKGFYNDTYLTDQNACTSPKIVIWIGDNVKEAQTLFWTKINDYVVLNYYLEPARSVEKLLNFQIHASSSEDVKLVKGLNNIVYRAQIKKLESSITDYFGICGYFIEYEAKSVDEIVPILKNECQTISYYGLNKQELLDLILSHRPSGVDRIVPIGKTLDFDLEWDGYDLIYSLSRIVGLK